MSNAIATFLPLLVVAIVGVCMGDPDNNNATMHMQSTVPPNEQYVAIYRDIDGMIALMDFVKRSGQNGAQYFKVYTVPAVNGLPYDDPDQRLLNSRAQSLISSLPISEILTSSSDECFRRFLDLSAELNAHFEIHLKYPSRPKDELKGDENPDTTLSMDMRSRADSVARLANCIFSVDRIVSLFQEMDEEAYDDYLSRILRLSDLEDAFDHRIYLGGLLSDRFDSDLNSDVDSNPTSSVNLISSARDRQDRIDLADYLDEMDHLSGSSSGSHFQVTMTLTWPVDMAMPNDELRPVLIKLLERPSGDSTSYNSECSVCLEQFCPQRSVLDMFLSAPPDSSVGDLTVSLECNHRFHIHCLLKWMSMRKTECPVCMTPIQL